MRGLSVLPRNPVHLARTKAKKKYETEGAQALRDGRVRALLAVIEAEAEAGDIVGKRDYALLLFFFSTGMRRSEVMRLRWGDVKINCVGSWPQKRVCLGCTACGPLANSW